MKSCVEMMENETTLETLGLRHCRKTVTTVNLLCWFMQLPHASVS